MMGYSRSCSNMGSSINVLWEAVFSSEQLCCEKPASVREWGLVQDGFCSFAGLALEGEIPECRWGSASCLSTPRARAPVDVSSSGCAGRVCARTRLPVGMTCIDGNPVECKVGKVFSTPTTNPVLELPMCAWGGKGDFKMPNHNLRKGIRAHQGEEAKQGWVLFVSIAPVPTRSEAHICSCRELRGSWVPVLSWQGPQWNTPPKHHQKSSWSI